MLDPSNLEKIYFFIDAEFPKLSLGPEGLSESLKGEIWRQPERAPLNKGTRR